MADILVVLTTLIFVITYVVMALGRIPGTPVDRSGTVILGALILLAAGAVPLHLIGSLVDLPVLLTLLALMVIGAHLQYANAFAAITSYVAVRQISAGKLLLFTLSVSALLSLVLVNDIIVFALAPLLCEVCRARQLNPKPYLLALATSANAGSAASLIGNPQNILLAEVGGLKLLDYFMLAVVPALITLVIIFLTIRLLYRHSLTNSSQPRQPNLQLASPRINVKQTVLSLIALIGVVVGFLLVPAKGYLVALILAALLTLIVRLNLPQLVKTVDVKLLTLIAGLFIITGAFAQLSLVTNFMVWAETAALLPTSVINASVFALVASNTIGNVPAVMLLLATTETMAQSLSTQGLSTSTLQGLALLTTLAGNLLLTGSLANIITAERAAKQQVVLTFTDFMRVGVPITLLSLSVAALWLGWLKVLPWQG